MVEATEKPWHTAKLSLGWGLESQLRRFCKWQVTRAQQSSETRLAGGDSREEAPAAEVKLVKEHPEMSVG